MGDNMSEEEQTAPDKQGPSLADDETATTSDDTGEEETEDETSD
jgi:hypothetical protein